MLGICGGFQMLGQTITDPHAVEGQTGVSVAGLGLLEARTEFAVDKVLRLPVGEALGAQLGYEIPRGRITVSSGESFLGGARADAVFGTMWHGSLEGDEFRRVFLSSALVLTPSSVSFPAARERGLDLLGDLVEKHLDVAALIDHAHDGVPAGLPILPPGRASWDCSAGRHQRSTRARRRRHRRHPPRCRSGGPAAGCRSARCDRWLRRGASHRRSGSWPRHR